MTTRNSKFKRRIKPYCFGVYKEFNVLPSVTAAQCVLESTWGTSGLTRNANNYFGMKARSGGKVYKARTREVGPRGEYYIVASFAKYDSMGESFAAYGRLMHQPRYKRGVIGERNYTRAVTAIKNGGYATDPNYIGLVTSVIRSNGFDRWDREAISGADGGYTGDLAGMSSGLGGGGVIELEGEQFQTFKNDFIKKNSYTRPGNKLKGVKGVVVHSAGSNGTSVATMRRSLNSGGSGRKLGYHILIDSKDTVGVVPLDEQVYHTKGKSMFEPFGSNADATTISVGIMTQSNGKFADGAVVRAAAVISELTNRYSFPTEFIKRGYDVDGSDDPKPWVVNQFDYSTFVGIVNYQKNQDVPLMNENLEQYYAQQRELGSEGSDITLVADGVVGKIMELSRQLQGYNMRYFLGPANIRRGGNIDCSSFTQYVYKHAAKIDLPRVSWQQANIGKRIPRSQARPGDLIFFSGTHRSGISHVGIVTKSGGTQMVNSAVNGGGNTIVWSTPSRGHGVFSHCQRVLSEREVSKTEVSPGAGLGSGLDNSKSYAIKVNSSINGYASDSVSSLSVKRYAKGTVLRVLSIGTHSYRVGDGMWVRKSDDSKYKLYPTGSLSNPIGAIRATNTITVKSLPSHGAPNVLESGSAKQISSGFSVEAYSRENGMYQISNPATTSFEEWVSGAGVEYNDYLEFMDGESETVGENFNVGSFSISEKTTSGLDPVQGRTIAANPQLLPLGTKVYVQVPSNPKFTGSYIVEHSLPTLSGNSISIYMSNAGDRATFGSRTALVREEK